MSIKHLYEDERPSLLLDFANSKTLDPRITFTRNSTGTYVDEQGVIKTAAANEARFDHDGTGECLGLLLEQSRTNFLTYSVDLTQQWATERSSITSNTTTAPDGTTTATTLTENTSNNSHLISGYTAIPQTGNGTHTFSVFAKAKERSVVALSTNQAIGTHAVATFDLQQGIVSQSGGTNNGTTDYVDSSIVYIGNGWYRCSLTYEIGGGVGQWPVIQIVDTPTYTYDSVGRRSYQGDGTSGVYIWGVQIEQNSGYVTSYIPTSGSTVTRNDDEAEITGTNLSDWFDSTGGTYVTEFKGIGYSGSLQVYLNFTQGNSRFEFYHTGVVMLYHNIATGYGHNPTYSMPVGQNNKSALSANFLDGSGSFTSNGLSPNVVAPVSSPSGAFNPTKMMFGYALYQTRGYGVSGHFKRFAYYKTRLGTTAVEALTK